MLLNYNPPMTPYLSIVYQDDDLLIVNKPSGLLTVPGKDPKHADCLIARVNRVFPTAKIVHRLDMATSGIICLAMHKEAHRNLSMQFQDRKTAKRYIARVFGKLEQQTGSVDLPLICDWPNRPKQMVDHDNGKPSLTHFKVLEHEDNATRVELTPITGRSHQLRVHMLSLGHPILGDRLYAHPAALAMAPRLQLHAEMLSLAHPVSGKEMVFEATPEF
ncbi:MULTISPECIES: bifunctional tRNA pseudouridine(32) synthase/23S rRNA pseudouridine(746) synthase RluA [unclassified Pseudoalteromonas]|uniref:bifunctional tRNA pseudouridine(32) synthase/23S rRNA pseudouridine(746) synthase RluA n=1 Tax=unclassified Pseudoalteromonas TaxID=194690 RepID=UPI00102327E3|nr:bifunctional tRNA pseudouridine(32) synthase/23S rRNA pseudouridine(746) synthase RluA [Pseudoalteromonas sp. L1]RZF92445.1 bifunctional tRNA pseudouridine(32) synthase/23S rRNA pseudouridine(746) synthase RluA [Pseudoalteromonas sp. CO302Y]RZG09138.1 bifunctional tRNA pseudouridine(32) synthase/23S rRNA pseudouridine(746) synthase RluA [Pseudoalteromonas sp. CO133X]WOC26891.1 bifunctional tRNA pseudouridine(32) synthase/23S rRNA pseudouridine(746) synthase RluA [Pseudoalteromonas sp. N1230-9